MVEKKIKEHFFEVQKVFFEKESGSTFLRVELNVKDLNQVVEISKKISSFLDNQNIEEENYFLDVYSSGTDAILNKNNLEEHLNKNVLITLKEKIKNKNEFEGELVSANPIIVKWNAKGQFRKQDFELQNIKEIKLYAKAGKNNGN